MSSPPHPVNVSSKPPIWSRNLLRIPRFPLEAARKKSSRFVVRPFVLSMYSANGDGSDSRSPSRFEIERARTRIIDAETPSTDTRRYIPKVTASDNSWCHRAWAASSSFSAITSASTKTRISCAAARAPLFLARADPNPAPSWRTNLTFKSEEGSSSGGSEASSTMITSNRSLG